MVQATDVGRRTRITRPYPSYTLEDALSVAQTIHRENAGLPFDRELLARALGTTPKSSAFTIRLNASAAYGLTEGGYNDPDISLTELGGIAVSSENHIARVSALIQAAKYPDTFGRFYEMLDGKRLPRNANLRSILQRDLGVREDLTEECLRILHDNGEFAGIISEADGEYLVKLPDVDNLPDAPEAAWSSTQEETGTRIPESPVYLDPAVESTRNIFIGHIGESDAAKYVATMLDEFGIHCASPEIPEEDTGFLIPEEISAAMKESSAAVLVFRSGDNAWSSRDKMIGMLGAASVLFEDRVVLLHEDGASLSINLDGLSHLDFDHDRPGESGMGLLVALHRAGIISVSA